MPICLVHYKRSRLTEDMLSRLGPVIGESVAKALNVPTNPELTLTANEVEVQFTECGPYDTGHKDIGIMIFGNGGTERQSNLKERVELIRADLTRFITETDPTFNLGLTLYIYVMLQNADYTEFRPGDSPWPGH